MAVKLRPAGRRGDGHPRGHHAPAFVIRTPEDFLELMRLRTPDPETGQPDMEKLGALLGDHPEAQTVDQRHRGRRAARELRDRSPTTRRTPSSSSTPTATAPGSATAGGPRPARQQDPRRRREARGRDYLRRGARASASPTGPTAFELLFQLRGGGRPARRPDRASGRTTASRSSPAGSRSPSSSTTRSAAATSRSSTPRGSRRNRALRRPDPPRPRARRTRSPPTGGSAWRWRARPPRRRSDSGRPAPGIATAIIQPTGG